MSQEKRIEYLVAQNKEIVRELTQMDYILNNTKSLLVKQQKAFKLLIEIQKVIAYSKTNKELYDAVAVLINSVFDMVATYIYEPDDNAGGEYKLLTYHEAMPEKSIPSKDKRSLSLDQFPVGEKYTLINNETVENQLSEKLKKKFGLSSLIVYPVTYNDNIELVIVTGINLVDKVWFLDITNEDVSTIEAVSILITSYLRKIELIRLHETDKYKTEFVSNISHEFRTPLTLVTGLLDQLRNNLGQTLDDNNLEKFEIIINNAQRIKELIDQLLDISRLETNSETLSVNKASLSDLVTTIAKSFFSLAQEKQIDFKFSFSDSNQNSWFDEDKLEKILTNLLSNAFKFTKRKGKVDLLVKVENIDNYSSVIFTVSDTGLGIPPGEKEKIFERFYQLNNPGRNKNEGTGIGLYLVKKLTEMHHGSIKVTSKINKGSKFTVEIPLDKNSYSESELNSESFKRENNYNKRINAIKKGNEGSNRQQNNADSYVLVVEDNKDLNDFISSSLTETFNVINSSNGKDGLNSAIQKIPDLIVTDIMMPEMDGYEMTRLLKDNDKTRHIPIIMLTAKADKSSIIEGLKCGADDYISKPFDMEELIIKVRNNIETCKRVREKFKAEFLTSPDESEIPSLQDNLVRDVINLMKLNIHDPNFQVANICKEIFISRTQLYRKIEALTGYNPGELLRQIRLKTAAAMFRKGHNNVAQVMYRVGFNNQSNFAKIFKEQFGLTPSSYMNQQLND
ncbi:MAG: response regulator [Bacteroidia bacterium]|nr:MAG: response regulator [Bacteroidia bacterium]